MTIAQKQIVDQLQQQILSLQGFKATTTDHLRSFGLGKIEECFPNGIFPIGVIHEFIAENQEHAAASEGFITGILAKLMKDGKACLWISRNRKLFPPGLRAFGVKPEQFIFIDLDRDQQLLWAIEESLKCEGISAVVGDLKDIDFSQSRRLQLAVEKSQVTGLILRKEPKRLSATACAVRWQIKPIPSRLTEGLPGVGLPHWQVELLKVRNGLTGTFSTSWNNDDFEHLQEEALTFSTKQTG